MKILLIRHGKVAMEWKKKYTPGEYDDALRQYDAADIVPVEQPQEPGDYKKVYVSSQRRAAQTARQLFPSVPESDVIETNLLNEVPLRSFSDSERSRPKWVYDAAGRLQWLMGKRQEETRSDTIRRADELIDLLEKNDEDVILISHGFFMNVLIGRLKRRRRYEVSRGSTFVISPLERVRVTDRQPHCGGCHHNCLLKNAGCVIGQDKARKAGIAVR